MALDEAAAYVASWYTSGLFERLTPAEQDYYRAKVAKLLELYGAPDPRERNG